ncbi:MAG TPA: DUF2076 domain-containing protein [Terracidiphilus sp.]|nr:DUF2076 domain-containing protein [Terracidiphilus sp.]
MTPQEEQLLNSLVERINQTQLQEKDPDAEALLNRELGSNPDALYMLAQTVLVQNIALDQAKAQVSQLQQQAQQARQPAHATSFLGNLLGRRDPEPAAQQAPPYQPVNPQYVQASPAPPVYAQPQYVGVPVGQPSFLRGAMQTAAGVAAGALAFEGVESILHGFGHPAYGWGGVGMGPGMGGGMMGGGFERPEETVINNYYDDPNQHGGMEHHAMEHGGEQHFHESADQGGAQLSDASYNTSGDDQGGNFDQASDDQGSYDQGDAGGYDDSNVDDGSGFDDGGGSDGGGFDSGGGDLL